MGWFSKKSSTTLASDDIAPEIFKMVRTMEDDVNGVPEEFSSKDVISDLKAREAKNNNGLSQEIRMTSPLTETPSTSPFLSDVSAKAPVQVAPVAETLSSEVFFRKEPPVVTEAPIEAVVEISVETPVEVPSESPIEFLKTITPVEVSPPSVSSATSVSESVSDPFDKNFGNNDVIMAVSDGENHRKRTLLIGGLVAGVIVIVVGAGIFFWKGKVGRQTLSVAPAVSTGEQLPVPETPDQPAVPEKRFTVDKPNVLSVDTETVTAENLQATLADAAAGVLNDHPDVPDEFLIKDQNFNPLAFSRFAYLLGLALPESVLSTLDEGFSLYVFIDNGQARFGLTVNTKDVTLAKAALVKSETGLGADLEPIFTGTGVRSPKTISFHNSTYNGVAIRYNNVDLTDNVSVDYAFKGTQWVIGTSKATLRAIVDRLP